MSLPPFFLQESLNVWAPSSDEIRTSPNEIAPVRNEIAPAQNRIAPAQNEIAPVQNPPTQASNLFYFTE
jgi:hypothetical protein